LKGQGIKLAYSVMKVRGGAGYLMAFQRKKQKE